LGAESVNRGRGFGLIRKEALRIAYVTYSAFPESAAVAHRIQMIAKGLASLGHELHILAPYRLSPGPLSEEIEGVQIHWGAHMSVSASKKLLATLTKRILLIKLALRFLKAGLDWMILYDMGPDALPFLCFAKIMNCSIAAETVDLRSCRNTLKARDPFDVARYKIGEYLIAPRVQLHIVISKFLEAYLRDIAPKVPRVIVPPPVDTHKYRDNQRQARLFRRKYQLDDSLVLMYLGSHWGIKGVAVLIEAFSKLSKEENQVKLVITGDFERQGSDQNLRQLVKELRSENLIIITGYLPENELVPAMSAADILIEPKTDHVANMAAFPQKLAEYLSVGKPIVASAVGDIPLYLQSGENALLCQAGNPQSLTEALLEMIGDAALRGRLAKNARATALKFFDCTKIAKRINKALLASNQ
jgi:glycosyltransferase involved in cell wall biosynthesis